MFKSKKKRSPKRMKEMDILLKKIELLKQEKKINSYIGDKGYSIYKNSIDIDIVNFIKEELTVKPFIQNSIVDPPSFPIYQESDKKIYMPRFWGIEYFGFPKMINLKEGENIDLKFSGKLRIEPVDQGVIVNEYLEKTNFYKINNSDNNLTEEEIINYKSGASALIDLGCGGGKTVIGLYILSVLKKKTIIFVQKTFLKNQWEERIREFLPDARIGTIQAQVIDIEDKDIVIAMVQSISMKSYPSSMFDSFGFAIYDEVHHMSSEVFSNCLKKCNTIYSLGLSATMNRKDGLSFVFKMYLGSICETKSEKEYRDNVIVKAVNFKVLDDDEYNEVETDFRGNIKYSTIMSKVSNNTHRLDFIVNMMKKELEINSNQQIILLAHTRKFLEYMFKSIEKDGFATTGYYVGGMKANDLKISESKKIILATYQMAAEALDIKSLTTLVLATPKSDIVQAVGRIMREKHSNPLIIDIIDEHEPFKNQFQKRRSFYNENKYKILISDNFKYYDMISGEKNEEDIYFTLEARKRKSKKNEEKKDDEIRINTMTCMNDVKGICLLKAK